MKKLKISKGITLVALIITIVVLLILAVVAINSVQEGGILLHAKNAQQEYKDVSDKEGKTLAYYSRVLKNQGADIAPTIEELQKEHVFTYYRSLSEAIEKINDPNKDIQNVNEADAKVGMYIDDGIKNVVLMDNVTENTTLTIETRDEVVLNLGGKTLTLTSNNAYLNMLAGTNVTIDGKLENSKIEKNINSENNFGIVNSVGNSLSINGGKYYLSGEFSNKLYAIKMNATKKFVANNAEISIENKATTAGFIRGIGLQDNNESSINNCKINITAVAGGATGIILNTGTNIINNLNMNVSADSNYVNGISNSNTSNLEINNCNIFTDSCGSDVNNNRYAVGIRNTGLIKCYSCSIYGTISGIIGYGNSTTYIYDSSIDGYTSAINLGTEETTKLYVENSTMQNGKYNGKYDKSNFGEKDIKQAIWIQVKNNAAYINNCKITGYEKAIGHEGDCENDQIYISNSLIKGKIEAKAIKIYFGKNNNITRDNISEFLTSDSDSNLIEFTNENYA